VNCEERNVPSTCALRQKNARLRVQEHHVPRLVEEHALQEVVQCRKTPRYREYAYIVSITSRMNHVPFFPNKGVVKQYSTIRCLLLTNDDHIFILCVDNASGYNEVIGTLIDASLNSKLHSSSVYIQLTTSQNQTGFIKTSQCSENNANWTLVRCIYEGSQFFALRFQGSEDAFDDAFFHDHIRSSDPPRTSSAFSLSQKWTTLSHIRDGTGGINILKLFHRVGQFRI